MESEEVRWHARPTNDGDGDGDGHDDDDDDDDDGDDDDDDDGVALFRIIFGVAVKTAAKQPWPSFGCEQIGSPIERSNAPTRQKGLDQNKAYSKIYSSHVRCINLATTK